MQTKLSLVRGDTYVRTLYFTKADGTVQDISGWTIWFTLKKNWQLPNSEASLLKTITSHIDAANGKSVLTLLPADTQNLDPGDYDFDIQVLANTGTSGTASEIYTLLIGQFELKYDVNKGTAGTAGT
jgi:hypothetical protein